jgi:hypothetical protein
MRTFINLLVIVSLLSLTGCIPGLFGTPIPLLSSPTGCLTGCTPGLSDTGGQASVQYGSPSGDTTGFVLTPFNTSQITASRFETTINIIIQANQDVQRTLFLTLNGQLAPGFTCPLKQGSIGGAIVADGCTLAYQQAAFDGSQSVQSSFTSGAVTVTAYDGRSLSFNFEATLQTPAGGSFTLQGSGSSSIQTY